MHHIRKKVIQSDTRKGGNVAKGGHKPTERKELEMRFTADNNYRLLDWGKSMYGGYFANLYNGEMLGIHTDTLKELRAELAKYGFKATPTKRYDNI